MTAHLSHTLKQWRPLAAYTQANALETKLIQHPSPELLVIATHGICEPTPDPQLPPKPGDPTAIFHTPDPMLRSGLALAGINAWFKGKALPPEAGKGFVTSRDIANLPLWGNALSVVVACNSGVGDIFDGEGVFGLRRAFATAGAQTLILSLWSVPEAVSVLLINHFFEQLRSGMGRAAALQAAQTNIQNITVRDLLQTEVGRTAIEQWANTLDLDRLTQFLDQAPFQHPFYWAAWICQGDDRPLSLSDYA